MSAEDFKTTRAWVNYAPARTVQERTKKVAAQDALGRLEARMRAAEAAVDESAPRSEVNALEAQAAAMREALEACVDSNMLPGCAEGPARTALASDAGSALLERLREAETQRARGLTLLGEADARAEKAEAERDALRAEVERLKAEAEAATPSHGDVCATCGHHRHDHTGFEDEPLCGALADEPVADCDCTKFVDVLTQARREERERVANYVRDYYGYDSELTAAIRALGDGA